MTTAIRVGLSLTFTTDTHPAADLGPILDRFYDELLDIEDREVDVEDPDMAAGMADLKADVEMTVTAESYLDAQIRTAVLVRAALHAAGVGTPGWEAIIASFAAPAETSLLDA